MALSSQALTTLAQAKAELGVTAAKYDAVIERLIETVSSTIVEYVDHPLHYEANFAERVPGFGRQLLYVSRTPIVSIASIELLPSSLSAAGTGTTYASTSYTIRNARAGIIFRLDSWDWTAFYEQRLASAPMKPGTEDYRYLVTYTGGYITRNQAALGVGVMSLPYEIEQACLWGVANLWRHRGREIHGQAETEDMAAMNWAADALPAQCMALLETYKRVL